MEVGLENSTYVLTVYERRLNIQVIVGNIKHISHKQYLLMSFFNEGQTN